ncbi:MAG TPA: sensor domain-containing diguanylate cyclase, partial [Thermoleophilaceae bacterium]|nr:sensor domain-containing diguanylate cyclase [Thermoleophilaceae bacterium]
MAADAATYADSAPQAAGGEPREASGLTSRLILAYVERRGGRRAVDAVLQRAGLADREEELRDENAWFADATRVRLFEAAAAVLDDPLVARRIGESAIDLGVGGALKLGLRTLGSPRLLYSNIAQANAKFNAVHRMDVLELGDGRARIRNVPLAGIEYHPSDCEYNVGLLSCVPALFGEPPARVSHPVCIANGADECIYVAEWTGEVRPAGRWVMAGLGGLAGSVLFARATTPVAAVAASGATALGGWRLLSNHRRRLRLLEAQAREQEESAERLTASLQDLVSALELDEVLDKVTCNAQAAVGGSEFVLLVEDSEGLRCRSSSGLRPESVAALERWAGSSPGLLEAPVLINDLGSVPELQELPAEPAIGRGSLCAAPLVYRERPLGVLVALAPGAEGFLPHDVGLLASYAAQAAIALTNARLYKAQQELASRDPLTGLLNHREFHDTVARELERCRRYGGELSVVVLDLDHFKQVNDAGGHAAGDRVLQNVASALAATCRASDQAFRVGGDEFVLVLPNTGTADAESAAERARVAVGAVDPRTSASSGVASWPAAGPTKDALLARADASLYEAKRAGGMVHGAGELIGGEHAPAPAETAPQRERLASAS